MHGAAPLVWEMFYGCDGQSLALRLDGLDKGVTIAVEFETGMVAVEIASGRITEVRARWQGIACGSTSPGMDCRWRPFPCMAGSKSANVWLL